MIIGITGKSGSGKTTLAKFFERTLGYKRISIDNIAWRVLDEQKYTLEAILGTSDKKEIGNIIFNDRKKYNEIASICWNHIQPIIDEKIKQNKNVVIEYILLPKTKYWDMCDSKILCKCPIEKRRARVTKRDNITSEYFHTRENASIEYDEDEMDLIMEDFYANIL